MTLTTDIVQPLPMPARMKMSQDAWDATSALMQSEICRMCRELTAEFEQTRAAARRDAELANFHEMAIAGGTDLRAAIEKYINLETLMRTDPIKAFEALCLNLGRDPSDVAKEILAS